MLLEDVTAEIRPRSDWEAVDLGFAMVRRNFWRCFAVWWLALLVPLAVAGWFLRELPLVLLTLFWWVKPAGSRLVLFELSRRLFGENPGWKVVLRELPKVWTRRFFYRFLWARLSPWQPVVLAVEELEGLRGKPYRQRASQLARRGDGVVMWIYFLTDLTAMWLGISLFAVVMMLLPEGQDTPWRLAVEAWDISAPADIPLLISWSATACLMVAMSLTDLFVTGAGFGIYVNNRTWLEGWDVELAFKRLGQRLGKFAALLVVMFTISGAMISQAQEPGKAKADAELMQEVKADKDFTVHSVIDHVPKETSPPPAKSRSGPSWIEGLFGFGGALRGMANLFLATLGILLLALVGWVIWRYRHAFSGNGGSGGKPVLKPVARVVMGMEISAASLPEDIPSAAWALWQQGQKHEALGLLYRGTISKVVEAGQVEIQESDTEGDCLRRVERAGAMVHPGYFRGLTLARMQLAYAGEAPAELEVEALCRDWPYGERRLA